MTSRTPTRKARDDILNLSRRGGAEHKGAPDLQKLIKALYLIIVDQRHQDAEQKGEYRAYRRKRKGDIQLACYVGKDLEEIFPAEVHIHPPYKRFS